MFAASKTDGAVLTQPDPFFDNVSLLLNTSGTNGAQNNTFIDSSTNNFTVTRNGNTTQGSVSPYGENWSNYFDGTGDFLTVASSAAFGFGTGDFTIEFWAFPLASTRQDWIDVGNGSQRVLLYYSGSSIGLYSNPPNSQVITGPALTLNAWVHIALSKQAGNTRLFVNGTQAGSTYTTNQNYGTTASVTIGKDPAGSTHITGYMSNVRVVKGTALYTANFTPSTTPLQPVAGTSLLTCKDPAFVDDSANQFTITRNGDVSVQKFAPFAATTLNTPYYGGYFDGSGDVLTLASNAALGFATGDFTLEMWYYTTVTPTATNVIPYTNGTSNFFLQVRSTAFGIGRAEVAEDNAFSFSFAANQWYHLAVSRSGSTIRGFVNGTLAGTGSNSVNYGQSGATIGGLNSSSFLITGHISNLRAVKGQALYTSDFTPSTVPLTTTSQGATASNVSLLTCQSNTFIDNSTNNFAITVVGSTRPTTFAPFAVSYSSLQSYTPAVFGGSAYFDGVGDVLTLASNAALGFATGDFTLETWYYTTVAPTSTNVCLYNNGSGNFFLQLRNTAFGIGVVGSAENNAFTFSFTANQWYHLAVSRSGSTVRGFVNGTLVGTGSNSINYGQSGATLGGLTSSSQLITGYISSFRTVKGTALYTSSFVPQNAPLTAVTNTSLLLNATNAGIYDAAILNNFETVGNAQVSTSVKQYGTSSMAFDGNGDFLAVSAGPANLPFTFGTGNFTIEMWVYFTAFGTAVDYWVFYDSRAFATAGDTRRPTISLKGDTVVYFTNAADRITSGTVSADTWYHLAVSRSGSSTRMFINGTQAGTTYTDTTNYNNSPGRPLIAGDGNTGTALFNGYIQDLRVTYGIARYTANFTPPTAAFPTF